MVAHIFAARLAGHGLNVHEVHPGIIATGMTGQVSEVDDRRIAEDLTLIRRWGTSYDVVRAVAALDAGPWLIRPERSFTSMAGSISAGFERMTR
jgi:3-oxoacyl-[acyl-carrier protein] reductase